MHSTLQPWQILLAALAGWVNRPQQHIIEYLQERKSVQFPGCPFAQIGPYGKN